jgi:hypothetical protein
MSLSPSERDANGNPVPMVRQRLILPADAFANAADLMQQVKNSLIESGIVSPGQTVQGLAPRDTVPFAGARPGRNTSPNFS